MPLLHKDLDLSDPLIDTTLDHCGNSLYVEEARQDYRAAFSRVMEYVFSEQLPGDVMEFGSYAGFTARILAESMVKYRHKGELHLFDSFEGFPETSAPEDTQSLKVAVQGYWGAGRMSANQGMDKHIFDRLSPLLREGKLSVHKGYFDKTLPNVIKGRKVSVVHLDADLYSSTKYVLDTMNDADAFQDGTVVVFDDFYCNRANPNFGEQAAMRDFEAENPHYKFTPWFTYSWGAAVFFLHDTRVQSQVDEKVYGA